MRFVSVIAKVKVCHDYHDDNDHDHDNDYAAADDTRVMTIPRLFFL